jgi:hypothetical protein
MSDRHRGMSDRHRDAGDARDAGEHRHTRDAREHTGIQTSIETLTLYVNASMSLCQCIYVKASMSMQLSSYAHLSRHMPKHTHTHTHTHTHKLTNLGKGHEVGRVEVEGKDVPK